MNKRLRKKKRVGRFQELGFEVICNLKPGSDYEAFVDRLIAVVEARPLCFGGGGDQDGKFEGFVARAGRGSATQEDRQALLTFLNEDSAVVHPVLGKLKDVWDD